MQRGSHALVELYFSTDLFQAAGVNVNKRSMLTAAIRYRFRMYILSALSFFS